MRRLLVNKGFSNKYFTEASEIRKEKTLVKTKEYLRCPTPGTQRFKLLNLPIIYVAKMRTSLYTLTRSVQGETYVKDLEEVYEVCYGDCDRMYVDRPNKPQHA